MFDIRAAAEGVLDDVIQDRRALHRCPEVGFATPDTAAYVGRALDGMGIAWRPCGGAIPQETIDLYERGGYGRYEETTGIVATIGSGSPCILLRADMDALPMDEETGLPFSSERAGAMHACGHDAHTAMLLGAARILKEHEAELPGTVKLMFQPGEEMGMGSALMMQDGLLENPRVDAAFALHVMPDKPLGQVFYAPGASTSSMDCWTITVRGRGGHSSQPQLTIDPNMIATQIYTQLNLLFTREADPSKMVTFSIGALAGGTLTNIIPDEAVLQANMRTLSTPDRNHLLARVPEMAECIARAWRGTCDIDLIEMPTTENDPQFLPEAIEFIGGVLGEDAVHQCEPMAGSEDFSYVSQAVPSAFVQLGAGAPGWAPVHNSKMVLDESALACGVAVHVAVALGWLRRHAGDPDPKE